MIIGFLQDHRLPPSSLFSSVSTMGHGEKVWWVRVALQLCQNRIPILQTRVSTRRLHYKLHSSTTSTVFRDSVLSSNMGCRFGGCNCNKKTGKTGISPFRTVTWMACDFQAIQLGLVEALDPKVVIANSKSPKMLGAKGSFGGGWWWWLVPLGGGA